MHFPKKTELLWGRSCKSNTSSDFIFTAYKRNTGSNLLSPKNCEVAEISLRVLVLRYAGKIKLAGKILRAQETNFTSKRAKTIILTASLHQNLPLQNLPSFVRDTTDLINKIENLNKEKGFLSFVCLLVSWDVVTM